MASLGGRGSSAANAVWYDLFLDCARQRHRRRRALLVQQPGFRRVRECVPLGHDCRERGGIVPHRFPGLDRSLFGSILATGIGSARVPHRGRVRGLYDLLGLQPADAGPPARPANGPRRSATSPYRSRCASSRSGWDTLPMSSWAPPGLVEPHDHPSEGWPLHPSSVGADLHPNPHSKTQGKTDPMGED